MTTIRPETPADFDAIGRIHLEAFANHPFSRQTEHLIVEELRKAGALNVSLVAVDKGEVLGHIAFSRAKIGGANCGWFMLGPVGVLPDMQRRGIGSQLVEAGLQAIRELGAAGCFLVGDPAFYGRFGFRPNPAQTVEGVPAENSLSLALTDAPIPEGEVEHHPAFMTGLS